MRLIFKCWLALHGFCQIVINVSIIVYYTRSQLPMNWQQKREKMFKINMLQLEHLLFMCRICLFLLLMWARGNAACITKTASSKVGKQHCFCWNIGVDLNRWFSQSRKESDRNVTFRPKGLRWFKRGDAQSTKATILIFDVDNNKPNTMNTYISYVGILFGAMYQGATGNAYFCHFLFKLCSISSVQPCRKLLPEGPIMWLLPCIYILRMNGTGSLVFYVCTW